MGTPHISADNNQIAKTVLMPGDPLRAKFIADTYLDNVEQFNTVRNMFGYTGTYKGKRISVMGSGMGMPSIGIYSYELFKFYDIDNIVRIGSCGAYTADLDLYDVVLVDKAWSESTYAQTQAGHEIDTTYPSASLNAAIEQVAKSLQIPVHKGTIHSSDVFYRQNAGEYEQIRDQHGCIAVEMESFALFHNANVLGKNAACLLTVSDNIVTQEETSAEERQNAFTRMMDIALGLAE
ncbi:purine-nucleoside phosphorylase [Candidatus Xianfuyuplasma coldseepsis]|uniref:Uridine phosphorylase n=1 Tax=Candidatus Xianfuyuplasma coldseepsis TaxID=2782163 RepID=A0A7L7KSW2_9MOLU|nr:purine-nucleoside phosphorylase [Xianfuyuplasma coldseepsis]QMS85833.1 purine-nucleoside phosphorylase [Xianfuyuplasma coldseepsis]